MSMDGVKRIGYGADFSRTCQGCAFVVEDTAGITNGKLWHRCNAEGPRKGYTVSNAGRFLPYVPAWCHLMGTGKEGTVKR